MKYPNEFLNYFDGLKQGRSESAAEIERLRAWNLEARAWLAQCLGFVTGEGPPSWDGIRAFLKITDQQTPAQRLDDLKNDKSNAGVP